MQRLTLSISSLCSTCLNHLNLVFLIITVTGSNHNSSSFLFLSFSLVPHIHLNHAHFCLIHPHLCSAFIGQVSLPQIRQLFSHMCMGENPGQPSMNFSTTKLTRSAMRHHDADPPTFTSVPSDCDLSSFGTVTADDVITAIRRLQINSARRTYCQHGCSSCVQQSSHHS